MFLNPLHGTAKISDLNSLSINNVVTEYREDEKFGVRHSVWLFLLFWKSFHRDMSLYLIVLFVRHLPIIVSELDTIKSEYNIDQQVSCNEKRSFDRCSNCNAKGRMVMKNNKLDHKKLTFLTAFAACDGNHSGTVPKK